MLHDLLASFRTIDPIALMSSFSYLGILGALALTFFGFPIPQDLPLFLGGILIHQQVVKPEILIPLCTITIYTGDLFFYFIGRRYGRYVIEHPRFSKILSKERLRRMQVGVEENLRLYILTSRFMSGLRLPSYLACGALRVPLKTFLLVDALSNLILSPLMIGLGYLLGTQIHLVKGDFRKIHGFITIIIIAMITMWSIRAYYSWYKAHKDEKLSSEDDDSKNKDNPGHDSPHAGTQ